MTRTVLIANPSPDVYGSDLQMLESVVALRMSGWRVVVVVPSDGPLVPKIQANGGEVHFLKYPVLRRANQSIASFLNMCVAALISLPRIYTSIRGIAPSVIYVNTVTLPWWLLASRLARVPTVCHLHEAENTDRAFVQRALVMPLCLAHAVIVISQSTMTAMVDALPQLQRKGHLIHNGVPQPLSEPQEPARRQPIQLVVVGRLSPRKAPHIALEAASELRARGLHVELTLAGSAFEGYDWYVDELRKRASRPDLNGRVKFAGYCHPIWPVLEKADIVVAPSLREPFGNAVVEAQLALRPVVATAALGHLESITDHETGMLVSPGDVPAMADAIEELINNPELANNLAEKARSSAIERFSTERYDQDIARLITSIADGK